jgi:outer membrane protein OmpA-like peptidoglycan-associated protein
MRRMSLTRNPVAAVMACVVLSVAPVEVRQALQEGPPATPVEPRVTAFAFAGGDRYTVDLAGTALAPNAQGKARVQYQNGRSQVKLTFGGLGHPQSIGPSYSAYVLWTVSPEGTASSIGELPVRTSFTFTGTTPMQSFGLMITAEPYATVTTPSAAVVAQSVARDSSGAAASAGSSAVVPLRPSAEAVTNTPANTEPDFDTPLPLLGAQRAVDAAGQARADLYAPEAWQDLQNGLAALQQSWAALQPDQARFVRQLGASAGRVMSSAEHARQVSLAGAAEARRRADESTARAVDTARRMALEAAVTARDSLVRAQHEAEAARAAAEQARTEAEREKTSGEVARAEAALVRAEAERTRRDAEAARAAETESRAHAARLGAEVKRARTSAQRAAAAAKQARAEAEEAQRAKDVLQRELLEALSQVIETRRLDRGVVCNFSDVLFDFDTATLTPGGREKLQKLAGVLLHHHQPYRVEIEGHADASGSGEYNVMLSRQRAEAVRQGLTQAGVDPERIVAARGAGSASPVASNNTSEGRQLNRRVEIIITEDPSAGGDDQTSSHPD